MNPLPWQTDQWQQLVSRRRQGKLPHAVLLSGPEGLGKHQFAEQFAASLLCQDTSDDGFACGQCRGCTLLKADTHPDIARIVPDEPGKNIKVDQIRGLSNFTVLSAQFEKGYKVVLLDPAENMNRAAANSLLKTLEEPADNTILLLLTSAPQRLLATIRSRCQRIDFVAPAFQTARAWLEKESVQDPEQWLEIADGAPLSALALANGENNSIAERYQSGLEVLEALLQRRQDPLSIAAEWQKQDAIQALRWLTSWVMDMIRLASASGNGHALPYMACPGQQSRLSGLANQLDLDGLHSYLGRLYEASRLLTTTQVNQQLILEEILIRWAALPKNRL